MFALVEIEWDDSRVQDFVNLDAESLRLSRLISVGYVVEESDEWIALARDRCLSDGDVRGVIVIAKVNITERRMLREGALC